MLILAIHKHNEHAYSTTRELAHRDVVPQSQTQTQLEQEQKDRSRGQEEVLATSASCGDNQFARTADEQSESTARGHDKQQLVDAHIVVYRQR